MVAKMRKNGLTTAEGKTSLRGRTGCIGNVPLRKARTLLAHWHELAPAGHPPLDFDAGGCTTLTWKGSDLTSGGTGFIL